MARHHALIAGATGAVACAMLRNLLDAVEPVAPGPNHVHFVRGSKVYGADLGPYNISDIFGKSA